MAVKAASPRKRLNQVMDRLNEVRQKRFEIYLKYNNAKNEKKRGKLRVACRPLDLLLETYFYQLWKAYKKFENELEEIDRYKGFDNKTRVVYCDSEFHLVVSPKGKFKYGYFCNC